MNSQKLGASLVQSASSSASIMMVTAVTGVVVARVLGPDGRGVLGVFQFVPMFMLSLFNISVFEASVVRSRINGLDTRHAIPTLWILSFSLYLVLILVTIVVLGSGALVKYGISNWFAFLYITTSILVSLLHQQFTAVETAARSFSLLNVERALSPTIYLLLVLVVYFVGHLSPLVALVLLIVCKLPTLAWRFWRFSGWLLGPIDVGFLREVIKLAPRLHLANFTYVVASQSDKFVVSTMWSSAMIGNYFVAYSVTGAAISLASQALQITLLPHFTGLKIEAKRLIVEKVFRLSLLVGVATVLPVFALANWIVPLVYGNEFIAAVDYVRGLSFSLVFVPAIHVLSVANKASERGRPGVEMALAALVVFGITWLFTGFSKPTHLFVAMTLANFFSIVAGLRHLAIEGSVQLGPGLLPRLSDAKILVRKSCLLFSNSINRIFNGMGRKK